MEYKGKGTHYASLCELSQSLKCPSGIAADLFEVEFRAVVGPDQRRFHVEEGRQRAETDLLVRDHIHGRLATCHCENTKLSGIKIGVLPLFQQGREMLSGGCRSKAGAEDMNILVLGQQNSLRR